MAALEARDVRQREELLVRADRVMRRRLALRAMQRRRLTEVRAAQRAGDGTAQRA